MAVNNIEKIKKQTELAYQKYFGDLNLDQELAEQICEYLTIHGLEGVDPMGCSCNVLICADTPEKSGEIGAKLAEAIGEVRRRMRNKCAYTELEILANKKLLSDAARNCSILLITGCNVKDVEKWNSISNDLRRSPHLIKIFCLTDVYAWERMKTIPDIFYRICNTRISINTETNTKKSEAQNKTAPEATNPNHAQAMDYEREMPVHELTIHTTTELLANLPAGKQELNVLLVSLSPFSKDNCRQNNFTYHLENGKEISVTGYYQMDPIPQLLKSINKKLDCAILLETSLTQKPAICYVGDYPNKNVKISPAAFFHERLKGVRIADVFLNELNPSEAIKEVAELLQKMSEKAKIHLYVDSHGGFRGIQLVVAALLSLLKDDRIDITTYTVQFGPDRINHRILLDESVEIFNFTSGMNEFTNYGRVDSLYKYLNLEKNKELLYPIQKISDGLLWCNIPAFIQGLHDIRAYYEDHKQVEDPYLALFQDRIHKDYGDMLKSEEPDEVEITRWCLKKGFYQQALTITESNICYALRRYGIVLVTVEGEKAMTEGWSYGKRGFGFTELFSGAVNRPFLPANYWDDKSERDAFNELFETQRDTREIDNKIQRILLEKISENEQRKYLKSWSVLDADRIISEACDYKESKRYGVSGPVPTQTFVGALSWNLEGRSVAYKNKLVRLIFMHKTIKDIRNNSNHASGKNPYKQESVKNALNYYLNLIERLHRS